MKKYDLSVLIPSRNEMFLSRTVKGILEAKRGATEVIVTLDGQWSDPPLEDHPDLTIIYISESVGQRAATNMACKLSNAKWVMKIDAHCILEDGFDIKLMEQTEDNWTVVPALYNLHAFDWVCPKCKNRTYQGPTLPKCLKEGCDGIPNREMIWKPRLNRRSEFYRFDTSMHFQYAGSQAKKESSLTGVLSGYQLSFDTGRVSPRIIDLFTDLTGSHKFFINTNYTSRWEKMSINAMSLSPINSGGGIRPSEVFFIRDEFQMHGITASPILAKMIENGNVPSSTSWNTSDKPSINKPMNHLMLTEIPHISISESIDTSIPHPTPSIFTDIDILKELRNIFSGEFIYSENAGSFHNGSVTLTPIYCNGIAETMSIQGSCFMLTRQKYWELDISSEEFPSWGQQGVEVACKTWLSGGRVVTNRNTWYAHMFRTQGGDFGFPYPNPGDKVQQAREYSKKLFVENTWPKQIVPLSWLIDKFKPLNDKDPKKAPDWHTEAGREMLDKVNKAGEEFYARKQRLDVLNKLEDSIKDGVWKDNSHLKKGIIYYTDNQLNVKLSKRVQKNLLSMGLPIVSTSLKPMDFGKNIHMKGMIRGYEAYFKQILTALENSDADIIYFGEHDWLMHPSHFDFVPPREDTFYYNWNWWRVRSSDGHAVRYDTQLLPGLVAYRSLLIKHYRKIIEILDKEGYDSKTANRVGFEPGTHGRVEEFKDEKIARFDSKFPNLDIRHGNNLTASKWKQDDFRSQKNCQNWKETTLDKIVGWDLKNNSLS